MSIEEENEQVHDYIEQLISQYLKQNGYPQTLRQFQSESNKSLSNPLDDEDLVTIIRDRINFNKLKELNKTRLEHKNITTPQQQQIIERNKVSLPTFKFPFPDKIKRLPSAAQGTSLVIHSSHAELTIDGQLKQCLLLACNDKRLVVHDIAEQTDIVEFKDTVVNRLVFQFQGMILSCNMNGELTFYKLEGTSLSKLKSFKLHNRLVTDLKIIQISDHEKYICSIGFDFKLAVHKFNAETLELIPIDSFKFMNNPSCIEYTVQDGKPVIFVGVLDSSLISAFTITETGTKVEESYKIALNDAEFNNHSFHPMSMVAQDGLLIISTNHIPYLRLITVLIPDGTSTTDEHNKIKRNMIVSNMNTMSLQDKYSSTKILQRGNGAGILIIGDDGVIRGVDFVHGEMIEMASIGKRAKTACIVPTSDSSTTTEQICICSTDKQIDLVW